VKIEKNQWKNGLFQIFGKKKQKNRVGIPVYTSRSLESSFFAQEIVS
jgi:hypothetical protein